MSTKQKEIIDIKKHGALFAIDAGFQLWQRRNMIYSINSSGLDYCCWCPVKDLVKHLRYLHAITGKRFETWPDVLIIDTNHNIMPAY